MPNGEPTNGGVEKATQGAVFILLARGVTTIGIPLILAVGGFVGSEVWGIVKKTSDSVAEVSRQLAGIDGSVKLTNQRIDDHNLRLDAQSRWLTKAADDIEKLKERVWTLAPPVPPKQP